MQKKQVLGQSWSSLYEAAIDEEGLMLCLTVKPSSWHIGNIPACDIFGLIYRDPDFSEQVLAWDLDSEVLLHEWSQFGCLQIVVPGDVGGEKGFTQLLVKNVGPSHLWLGNTKSLRRAWASVLLVFRTLWSEKSYMKQHTNSATSFLKWYYTKTCKKWKRAKYVVFEGQICENVIFEPNFFKYTIWDSHFLPKPNYF